MLHAHWDNIAAIKQIMHVTMIAPIFTTIRDTTPHPHPCISTFIVDDATMLE
jgi:hypothetical protein